MTPFERKILAYMIAKGGEVSGQQAAYDLCRFRRYELSGKTHVHHPTPQRASQIGGSIMRGLVASRCVDRVFGARPLRYKITLAGREAFYLHALSLSEMLLIHDTICGPKHDAHNAALAAARKPVLLQIVTCPRCGAESRLNSAEVVGPDIILECQGGNCGLMFFAGPENTKTFEYRDGKLIDAPFPPASGPTDEQLRNA